MAVAMAIAVVVSWLYLFAELYATLILWSFKCFQKAGDLVNGTVWELIDGLLLYAIGWLLVGLRIMLAVVPVVGVVMMMFS